MFSVPKTAKDLSYSTAPKGLLTFLINSFDYPILLCLNSPPTQHKVFFLTTPTIHYTIHFFVNRLLEYRMKREKGIGVT